MVGLATRTEDSQKAAGPERYVAAVIAGDRAAAEALCRALLPRVRNLVRYLIRGDMDVDDAAQQSLIEILRGLPTYRGEGSFQGWADRIVARTTLSHVRRRRAERGRRDAAAPHLRLMQAPEAQADGGVKRREVAQLLDNLPEEQREVVILHHVLGLSAPEIAEELSIPFETTRSRLRLGMRKLREMMGVSAGQDP